MSKRNDPSVDPDAMDVATMSVRHALERHVFRPEVAMTAWSPGPDGVTPPSTCPTPVVDALRRLDDLLPLVRDVGGGVWERLELYVWEHDRGAVMRVVNALGSGERISAWHVGPRSREPGRWAMCRVGSRDFGTGWDVARRGPRRVVPYFDFHGIIDPGAHRIVDLVTAAGATTRHSCEGHPEWAYLVYDGAPELRKVFARAGWRTEEAPPGTCVRMPKVRNVHERDARWRALCKTIEAHLRACGTSGTSTSPVTPSASSPTSARELV